MADKERSAAERLRADSWQLVVGAEDRTRNRQVNNTKKLGTIIIVQCLSSGNGLTRIIFT